MPFFTRLSQAKNTSSGPFLFIVFIHNNILYTYCYDWTEKTSKVFEVCNFTCGAFLKRQQTASLTIFWGVVLAIF